MNKINAAKAISIALFLAISGCATIGQKEITEDYLRKNLIAGKTSESDVRALLGEPTSQYSSPDGTDKWDYKLNQHSDTTLLAMASEFSGSIGKYAGMTNSAAGYSNTADSVVNGGKSRINYLILHFKNSILLPYTISRAKVGN